jgi:hypothetical protein
VAFSALFDACVLYPQVMRDVLLSLARTGQFRARWTIRIREEWTAALLAQHPEWETKLKRTHEQMETAVPDAVITEYEALEDCLDLPDANDKHVLAAAIVGRADVIVTTNIKHFPPSGLSPYKIDAQHPDEFISHVLTLDPTQAVGALKGMRARLKAPSFSAEEFLALLTRRGLPRSTTILAEYVGLL